jgi:Pentapeptide repeats (9 copies)
MDTNSNIPPQKKVVRVEILHLKEKGYGPQGTLERGEWRKECFDNLSAGKEVFEAWQEGLKKQINKKLFTVRVRFDVNLIYDDGSESIVLDQPQDRSVPYTLDFAGHNFSKTLKISHVGFQHNAIFAAANFFGIVRFRNAIFKGALNFKYAIFNESADFSDAKFAASTNFSDVIFNGFANFERINFNTIANFEKSLFKRNANFHNATLNKKSYFLKTIFSRDVNFSKATFCRDLNFSNTYIAGIANFRNATFSGDANFSNHEFGGDCYFTGATFTKKVSFIKAKFNNQCRFDFDDKRMIGAGYWERETWFMSAVNFENAEIQNVGHFERARFKGEIPNFLGVDNAKTLLVFSNDEYFNKEDISEDAVKRLGQLKRLADEQGQSDQALMFNKFELNAKRAQARIKTEPLTFLQKLSNSDFWSANATALYDGFSNYGRSFTRPLKWYFALLLITFTFALSHAMYLTKQGCDTKEWYLFTNLWLEQIDCEYKTKEGEIRIPLTAWRAAFEYTSYRASGILDFADSDKQTIAIATRLFGQPIEPGWMRIWGVFKAIASTALLFLAALGLRNKYRIK